MKIAIVGSGAIGCYYGARLLQAGNDVRFLMRSDLETVRSQGLRIMSPAGNAHLHNLPAYATTREIGPVDLVFIALKSTANDALPALVPPLLGPDTAILTLQNGLGNEEFLGSHFGHQRILGGLGFVCITRTAPGVIEHYGHGSIVLGEARGPGTPRAENIVATFLAAHIQCRLAHDMVWEHWRKLVWNIPFNGLSVAAGKATVEDLLASPVLRREVEELMLEVITAAGALAHPIDKSVVPFEIERSLIMGPYRPSSLVDYERGLPVEVEAIWGEPLRQTLDAGIQVPRLALLHALLTRLTAPPTLT